MTLSPRLARVVAFFLLSTAGLGCGGPEPCIVTGKVLVDGEPAGGVYVVLHASGGPAGGSEVGTDRSGEDGTFSIVVDEPGDAVVTAFRPRAMTTKEGDAVDGADDFRGRYRDPQSPVAKLSVRRGANTLLPIELKAASRSSSRLRR